MVLYPKFACDVICRLNGEKSGRKTGMKLNIAAHGVATTNNAGCYFPCQFGGRFSANDAGPSIASCESTAFLYAELMRICFIAS